MSVQRFDGNIAFTSAVRLQYTDDLADVFKDYANPDGTAVEFRILVSQLVVTIISILLSSTVIRFIGTNSINSEPSDSNRSSLRSIPHSRLCRSSLYANGGNGLHSTGLC